jgi:hypothetical protein
MGLDAYVAAGDVGDARQVIRNEIQAKWDKISPQEIAALRNSDDFALELQKKYGFTETYAAWEVQTLLKGRTF